MSDVLTVMPMHRRSTAAEVQHGNLLEQLVSLVSPSYKLSVGIELLAADIHQQLMKMYRKDVMPRQQVAKSVTYLQLAGTM